MKRSNIVKTYEDFKNLDEKRLLKVINDQLSSKNPEHPFIKAFKKEEDLIEIKSLWNKGKKDEAARLLRAKLIKIQNTKVGIALLLMISGSSLTSAGYNAMKLPPPAPNAPIPQPPQPEAQGDIYTIKKGDSIWKIAKMKLGGTPSDADIMAYTKQIASENGMNVKLIDSVLSKIPGDPDLIFPGGKLIINAFKG